jgi:hypothetical protein
VTIDRYLRLEDELVVQQNLEMSDFATQNGPINLLELPEDILQDMLLLLGGNDLGTCRLVSAKIREGLKD